MRQENVTAGRWTIPDHELEWTFGTSGGPGGQHANKTESAVRLRHRPSGTVVTSQQERSQHRNKQIALDELRRRLERHNHRPTPRTKTKPTKASKRRRLEAKRQRAEVYRVFLQGLEPVHHPSKASA